MRNTLKKLVCGSGLEIVKNLGIVKGLGSIGTGSGKSEKDYTEFEGLEDRD